MKNNHRLTVIAALAVLAAAWGPLCGNVAADDRKMIVVSVRIRYAEEDGNSVMQLLVDPTLYGPELRADQIIRRVPLIDAESRPAKGVGGTTLLATLALGIPPGMTEKAAFENVKAGLKRLETVLRTEHADNIRRLAEMANEYQRIIMSRREELKASQGGIPSDPSAKLSEITKAVEDLRGQIRESEIQNAAKEARLKATEEELAKLAGPREGNNPNNSIATELAKIVELCEKQLQTVKARVAQGQASQDDLEKAALKLAEAKVELARCPVEVRTIAGAHSPELVAKLRGEATTLVIDLKELAARREAAKQQLRVAEAQQVDLLKARKEFQAWRLGSEYETSLMKRELERAQARRAEIHEQLTALELVRPTVTIIDRAELDGGKEGTGGNVQPPPKR